MNLEGELSRIRLPKVLLSISAQDGNGILTVQGDDDIVAVSFVQGNIVTADALNQTVEDGLGKVVQSKGWVSSDDFQSAVRDYQGGSSGSLGDLLVERGLIDRSELLEALRLQTLRSMLQLLIWKNGEFKFYSGDEVSFEEGFHPITVDELLIRAVDKIGDRVGLMGDVPDPDAILRQVPSRGAVQVFGRDGDGLDAGIWISQRHAAFLKRVDGRSTGTEMARDLSLNRHQMLFTIYYLTQFDLIEAGATQSMVPLSTGVSTTGSAAKPSDKLPAGGRPGTESNREPLAQATSSTASPPTGFRAAAPSSESQEHSALDDYGFDTPQSNALDDSMAELLAATQAPPAELRAEIFTPPDKLTSDEQAEGAAGLILEWGATCLAALFLVGLLVSALSRPVQLLLPFPWQDIARSTQERQVRNALFQRIDRAARTSFLLDAHYPDRLDDLRASGLLTERDLEDPAGLALDYSSDIITYRIDLEDEGAVIEGLGTTEGITGDFLVDPQFLSAAATAEAPLVLLD